MKKVTWRSPSNIALVKYWGKKSGVQIPANPSISFTLDQCHSETSVSLVEKEGKGKELSREMNHTNVSLKDRKFGTDYFLRPQMIQFFNCKNIFKEGQKTFVNEIYRNLP